MKFAVLENGNGIYVHIFNFHNVFYIYIECLHFKQIRENLSVIPPYKTFINARNETVKNIMNFLTSIMGTRVVLTGTEKALRGESQA